MKNNNVMGCNYVVAWYDQKTNRCGKSRRRMSLAEARRFRDRRLSRKGGLCWVEPVTVKSYEHKSSKI